MAQKNSLIKILAVAGTVLAWVPVLVFVGFAAWRILDGRGNLMNNTIIFGEFLPVAVIAGGLLIWAALRAHASFRFIAWTLAAATALVVVSQVLAVVTGLARDASGPAGAWIGIVAAMLFGGGLAMLLMAIGAIRLLRAVFKPA